MQDKTLTKTISYKIEGIALFEDRRFKNSFSERFLFVNKGYLNFPEILSFKSLINPISLDENSKNEFIYIKEVKTIISNMDYNNLLCEIFEFCTNFEMTNIVFPLICENSDFDKESINRIMEYSLKNKSVRNSFTVQSFMLGFIYTNKSKMNSTLFHKGLSDFPHKSGGLGWVESIKL
jgi:hypothetical protein